ncbi:Smr/MutS family protein [Sphingomonas rubra]
MASVRPLKAAIVPVSLPQREQEVPRPARLGGTGEGDFRDGPSDRATFAAMLFPQRVRTPPIIRTPIAAPKQKPDRQPQNTLDGSWDKKLGRGMVLPDSSIDLHGHTLASAHALLDQGLDRAVRRGDRVLLLVTGKPPRPESERPHARGAIRAAVADWLAASRFADSIAAVRGAHPRHGGHGALYIVLRRPRGLP